MDSFEEQGRVALQAISRGTGEGDFMLDAK